MELSLERTEKRPHAHFMIHLPSGESASPDDPLIGHAILHPSEVLMRDFSATRETKRQMAFNAALVNYLTADGDTYAVTQTVWDDREVTYAYTGRVLKGDQTGLRAAQDNELEDFVERIRSLKEAGEVHPYDAALPTKLADWANHISQRLLLYNASPASEGSMGPLSIKSGQTDWAEYRRRA